ncbi:hypothetical protein CPJ18_22765 [Agrobacterium rosae]|uniref:Uncharacterized protein n=1 Tax=Agrobacterium rosae TaxID=1972867 RepID=A0AAE5RTF6_9HYPH|nr:hypothetical protein DXM25_23090 [Agrobacterium rosae]MQB50982.1 hypothetical protein [Agrobacterium rosae]POO48813.1 hypothetical protein CPJ18_22765 [Agrobacterium rosae]
MCAGEIQDNRFRTSDVLRWQQRRLIVSGIRFRKDRAQGKLHETMILSFIDERRAQERRRQWRTIAGSSTEQG